MIEPEIAAALGQAFEPGTGGGDCCSASNFDPLDSNNVNGLESRSASNTHVE